MAETTPGPTPSGGAYGVLHFLDADGAETTRTQATHLELCEYASDGELIAVTTSSLSGTTQPPLDWRARERRRLEELLEIYRAAVDELKALDDPDVTVLLHDLVDKLVDAESDLARLDGRLASLVDA